jgi:hypothetical protein
MRRLWLCLVALPLAAHMVSMSTGELRVEGDRARYELRMPSYEVAHVTEPDRSLLAQIHFRSGGAPGRLIEQRCSAQEGTYVCVATYQFPAPVDSLDVDCHYATVTVPNHVHLLRAYRGDKVDQAVFDMSYTSATLRFRPPSAWELAVRELAAGFLRAVGGAAPILFLASLVLAARSRRELAALTAALFAGEVAACLAGRWSVPWFSPRFIEAAAALTIAYLAFEIVLLPKSGYRWLVVGTLGLFQGTWFVLFLNGSGYGATVFLSGVLAGELLAIGTLALLTWKLPRKFVPVAASILLATSLVWFFVRLRS